MAYTLKGLSATTLYKLYAAHVGAGPTKLNGVSSINHATGATYFAPQALGALLPKFRSVNFADPQWPFNTMGLGQLITAGAGIAPIQFTGDAGDVFTSYWAAMADLARISDVGVMLTMTKGVIHLDTITAAQDALATAQCAAIAILKSGETEPWTRDDVASLSSTVGPLAPDDECWTLGDVTIAGTKIELCQGWTFQNVPFVTVRAAGSPYAKYGHVAEGSPAFVVQLRQPTSFADLGISGLTAFGAKTIPAVNGTSAVFNLARCDANAVRKPVGDGDINCVVNYGSLVAGPVPGGLVGDMVSSLTFYPHDDGNNTSVVWNRNPDV